jgi:hypothetical protein
LHDSARVRDDALVQHRFKAMLIMIFPPGRVRIAIDVIVCSSEFLCSACVDLLWPLP